MTASRLNDYHATYPPPRPEYPPVLHGPAAEAPYPTGCPPMMTLLFVLFLTVMVLTLVNREKASFVVFGVAIVLSTLWFLHHASSTLTIQL